MQQSQFNIYFTVKHVVTSFPVSLQAQSGHSSFNGQPFYGMPFYSYCFQAGYKGRSSKHDAEIPENYMSKINFLPVSFQGCLAVIHVRSTN